MTLKSSLKRIFSVDNTTDTQYEIVETDAEENPREKPQSQPKGRLPASERLTLVVGTFVASLALFISFTTIFEKYINKEKNENIRKGVYWSPILDEVEIPSYTALMNGTLFSPPNPSIARKEPGPENDAEWMKYVETPIFWLTREEVIGLGKDPDTAARLDRKHWGIDEDIYMGKFDVSHEIHCVDTLRKMAFLNYPGYNPRKHHGRSSDEHEDQRKHDKEAKNWTHLGHCADMLLQFLLCNSDPAILTMSYVEGQIAPWPDFNINRQCRDYGSMMEWAKSRELDKETRRSAPQPPDAHVWPNPYFGADTELGRPLGHHHMQEGNPKV